MNQGTASTKATRNPNRVDAQLRRRRAEKAAALAEVPAPAEFPTNSGESSDIPVRRAIGKLRRAFRKAGQPDASEETLRAFLDALRAAGVPVMRRTSGRLAKVVKGERTVESLLLARGGKQGFLRQGESLP